MKSFGISLFVIILSSTLFCQETPSAGEVIKFDSLIQDEPRIKFSKGVEESVAPSTGALTVKIPLVSLAGKGIPLNIEYTYNSSSVQSFIDEEIGSGTLSKFGTMGSIPIDDDFYGGCFHDQYGVRTHGAVITEGLIQDINYSIQHVVIWAIKQIPDEAKPHIMKIVEANTYILNVDAWDNSNLRTFIAQMTPCVGEVRGFIGENIELNYVDEILNSMNNLLNLDFVNLALNLRNVYNTIAQATSFNKFLNALDQPTVILKDGTSLNFKREDKRPLLDTYTYKLKQPDLKEQYNLVAKKNGTKYDYYFQMKDGLIYRLNVNYHFFYYFGANIDLKTIVKMTFKFGGSGSGTTVTTGSQGNFNSGLMSVSDFVPAGLKSFLSYADIAKELVEIYARPYGVVEEISDLSGNISKIEWENSNDNAKRISKVTDTLGRAVHFNYHYPYNYSSADLYQALSDVTSVKDSKIFYNNPFFLLKNIQKPDGTLVHISYEGDERRFCPERINITDSEKRITKVYLAKEGENAGASEIIVNPIFLLAYQYRGPDLPYFYVNRIDYPTGGYVDYELEAYDKYTYKDRYPDRNLTEKAVIKRTEHTSIDGSRDVKDVTTFTYNYDVADSQIVSFNFSINMIDVYDVIKSMLLQVNQFADNYLKISRMARVYIKKVKEVRGGTTTVTDTSGKTTVYTLKKSTLGNFNHYILKLNLSTGLISFDAILPHDEFEEGYKPARIQITGIDEKGNDCEGITTLNEYDDRWYLIKKTVKQGELNKGYEYMYDFYGNLTCEKGPLNSWSSNHYGLQNNTDYVNFDNLKFLPNLITVKQVKRNTELLTTSYFYDNDLINPGNNSKRGLVTKQEADITSSEKAVTLYSYRSDGLIQASVDPSGVKTTYTHDFNSGANTIVKTVSIVNTAQKRDGTINNESIVTKTVQNWNNEFLIEETDAKNNITRYAMDLIGRITNVIFADGTFMTYSYNDSYAQYSKGLIYVDVKDQEQINKSHGHYLRYAYDGLGRLKKLTQCFKDQNGIDVSYASENFYNSDGTLRAVRDAQGRETHLVYDAYRRLKRIEYPDDTELATGYSYSGYSTYIQTLKDANGTVTTYKFDVLGRLVAVTEPATVDASTGDVVALPHTTTYDYDTLGNLLSFTDAKNRTTSYQYDLMNRLVLETYPDNSTFSYSYDKNNNIIHKVDARGVHIKYDYDSLNRLYKIHVDNNNGISHIALNEKAFFEYDLNGNRTFARNEHSSAEFVYNNRNWLTSETRTIESTPYTFGYTYNTVGDLLTTAYPSGYKSYNSVDTLHRVLNVKYSKPGESILNDIVRYNYNPMGTISNIINANGVNQDFVYDKRDRVNEFFIYRQSDGRDTPILWQRYEYDKVGNRIADNTYESEGRGAISEYMAKWKINSKDKLGARVAYSYDSLYRLTGVHYPGVKPHKDNDQRYLYDSVGNRMRHEFELGEHDFEYNNLNQLTKMIVNHGEAGTNYYSWDANGNLAREEKHSLLGKVSEKDYFWNYDDRLTKVDVGIEDKVASNQEGSSVVFKRDFDGTKVVEETLYGAVVKEKTTFVKKTEEYGLDGSLKFLYIEGFGRINALRKNRLEVYHKDFLNSTVLITDIKGSVIENNTYDPFGVIEKSKSENNLGNDVTFTGQKWNRKLGFFDYNPRPYDPGIGRWLGRDFLRGRLNNPKTLNRYQYCLNNPFVYVDVDGMKDRVAALVAKTRLIGKTYKSYRYINNPGGTHFNNLGQSLRNGLLGNRGTPAGANVTGQGYRDLGTYNSGQEIPDQMVCNELVQIAYIIAGNKSFPYTRNEMRTWFQNNGEMQTGGDINWQALEMGDVISYGGGESMQGHIMMITAVTKGADGSIAGYEITEAHSGGKSRTRNITANQYANKTDVWVGKKTDNQDFKIEKPAEAP